MGSLPCSSPIIVLCFPKLLRQGLHLGQNSLCTWGEVRAEEADELSFPAVIRVIRVLMPTSASLTLSPPLLLPAPALDSALCFF